MKRSWLYKLNSFCSCIYSASYFDAIIDIDMAVDRFRVLLQKSQAELLSKPKTPTVNEATIRYGNKLSAILDPIRKTGKYDEIKYPTQCNIEEMIEL